MYCFEAVGQRRCICMGFFQVPSHAPLLSIQGPGILPPGGVGSWDIELVMKDAINVLGLSVIGIGDNPLSVCKMELTHKGMEEQLDISHLYRFGH